MKSFSGSSDLVPPNHVAPEQLPERCSLCGGADPQWWYSVEAMPDGQDRVLGVRALGRWWAVCSECHHLVAEGAVQSLLERITNRTRVAWWQDAEVPLFNILVHLLAETSRHAGHADILREALDGTVGTDAEGMAERRHDPAFWTERREEIEAAARAVG